MNLDCFVSINTWFPSYEFVHKSHLVTCLATNYILPVSVLESVCSSIKRLHLNPTSKLTFPFPNATKVYFVRNYAENVAQLFPSVEKLFIWDNTADDEIVTTIEDFIRGHKKLEYLLWMKSKGFQQSDLSIMLQQRSVQFRGGSNHVLRITAVSNNGFQWVSLEYNGDEEDAYWWSHSELDQFFD